MSQVKKLGQKKLSSFFIWYQKYVDFKKMDAHVHQFKDNSAKVYYFIEPILKYKDLMYPLVVPGQTSIMYLLVSILVKLDKDLLYLLVVPHKTTLTSILDKLFNILMLDVLHMS
ncbi:unnamed protein product [Trifolium pratense]|uniref:Uncharacterized protein n=1 Tax=Trifolium pratense TaxID=57577 RepID=A0ACB0JQ52_TRIPR|nr:unnamed protein product [Trifolium pratense]